MKPRLAKRGNHALTLMEVLVVIGVLMVIAAILLPPPISGEKKSAQKISCTNNLKQLGLDFKIWAGDNHDKYPMEVSVTNGGAMELIATLGAWKAFQVMSNELGTPIILHCPGDFARSRPATNFTDDLKGKISYFTGMSVNNFNPQLLLSGDDNFLRNHSQVKPGPIDVSSPAELEWNGDRHRPKPGWFSATPKSGGGNILLTDGSVQSVTTSGLKNLIEQTGLTTNRLIIP